MPVFLVQTCILQYDHTKIQINQVIPYDTAHGGPFDTLMSIVQDLGNGRYRLSVAKLADYVLADPQGRLLLFTIEVEGIAGGDGVVLSANDIGPPCDDGKMLDYNSSTTCVERVCDFSCQCVENDCKRLFVSF